uniref:Damage-inducible protein DinB n=1 Tax=Neobodo designis TaxID=312471 RepID=A0A7S1PQ40_NEODS|mmetsp:Transcript_16783/g.52103  ORF Transcript_16783/g.52103 Transcript_16783/m.52103 type:complete len:186 (+) Transcript_16783:42-599(+)
MSKPVLSFLATYNVAACRHVLERIGESPDVASKGPLKCLFFDTIHATVNHIAGVDELWRLRLSGQSSAAFDQFYVNDPASSGIRDGTLWLEREPDWARSRAAALDAALATQAFVEAQSEDSLREVVSYARTDGSTATIQRGPALLHLLNHATHHRGQIHAGLTELGVGGVVLDMPALLGNDSCRF